VLNPGDPEKSGCNPLAFVFVFFLIKRRRFNFYKKIEIDPDNPVKTQ
jgi:hypothetical protein